MSRIKLQLRANVDSVTGTDADALDIGGQEIERDSRKCARKLPPQLRHVVRLISRLRRERREIQVPGNRHDVTSSFVAHGIPVSFDSRHPAPAVGGVIYPRIWLPIGIDRLLNRQELDAVLIHEMAHARRRDNLIRLLYEVSLCALWFHPLIWPRECG